MRIILMLVAVLIPSALFAGTPKMIDQLEQININGSRQWLLYRGNDIAKPLVLFVHGGPGSPLMLFSRGFDDAFLSDFVVVHWDQRGSGKSYDPKIPIETFSAEQVANDGMTVVEHLKKKFGRSKVLLVGHSWGSIVGAYMVKKSPADFISYISVGTVADMKRGDDLKYEYLIKSISKSSDQKDRAALEKMGKPPWRQFPQLVILSRLMTKYKGSFYGLNSDQINAGVEKNNEYSEAEMKTLDVSMEKIWHQIFPFLSTYKSIEHVANLGVKTYFAQGSFDMATPTSLAETYFDQVKCAAGKKLVLFLNSAHFPMFEEPKKFLDLLKEASAQ